MTAEILRNPKLIKRDYKRSKARELKWGLRQATS